MSLQSQKIAAEARQRPHLDITPLDNITILRRSGRCTLHTPAVSAINSGNPDTLNQNFCREWWAALRTCSCLPETLLSGICVPTSAVFNRSLSSVRKAASLTPDPNKACSCAGKSGGGAGARDKPRRSARGRRLCVVCAKS